MKPQRLSEILEKLDNLDSNLHRICTRGDLESELSFVGCTEAEIAEFCDIKENQETI